MRMSKRNEIILCEILLTISLLGFILHIFIFEKPDGTLGLLLCIFNICIIIGSIIKLSQLSKWFRNNLLNILDLLFFIR